MAHVEISPGPSAVALVGGRLRLDDRVGELCGISLWEATDELLCRPVTVHMLAAAIVGDGADALAATHDAGRPHLCLCLGLRSLRWGASGVKITGLDIEAGLAGLNAGDPAAADTRALGRSLYALPTGCWPGEDATMLPPAPQRRGRLYAPWQVRAPGVLNSIVGRTLQPLLPGASGAARGLAPAVRD